jgi:hypothetical protein
MLLLLLGVSQWTLLCCQMARLTAVAGATIRCCSLKQQQQQQQQQQG